MLARDRRCSRSGFGIVKLIALPFGGVGHRRRAAPRPPARRRRARRPGPRRAPAPGEGARRRGAAPAQRASASRVRPLLADRARPVGPARRASRSASASRSRQRFNVAPGDDVLAVTTDREGAPRGELLRWGLVPHWAKDPAKVGFKMINARAETVAEKPAFRDAFARRRCLIVADGFYEWQKRRTATQAALVGHARRRRAVRLRRPVGDLARRPRRRAAAHLHDRHDARRARALAHIHDRMPVMLPPGGEAAWLDAATPPRRPAGAAARRSRRPARARSARPSTTRATTAPTASSPRPRRSRSSERAPVFDGFETTDDRHRRGAGSTCAAAAAGRRCCCCTAIRRPTSCGTGRAGAGRGLHRRRDRPARLRRELEAGRRPPTTSRTRSGRWRATRSR